jgi:hypothetical protein
MVKTGVRCELSKISHKVYEIENMSVQHNKGPDSRSRVVNTTIILSTRINIADYLTITGYELRFAV